MSKLIKFSQSLSPKETLEQLVKRTQELAKEAGNIYWDCPHVQQRMKERSVTIRQMLDVLRHGKGIDGPTVDKYGDVRIKLKRYTAGRSVQIVVVVKQDHLEVITVI